jgi:galactokinase
MPYYCYMLECANGRYYTGWSTDPFRRLKQHNAGLGAKYTRMNGPSRLVYVEEMPDHSTALKRELRIKQLKHPQKEALVADVSRNKLPELLANLQSKSLNPNSFVIRSPARVNLMGEHVDYNEGVVLPAAIDRYVTLRVDVLDEPVVRLHAADLKAEVAFSLEDLADKKDLNGQPLPAFALYPAGVAWALQQAGLLVRGVAVQYSSDIPIGAGLSSSAAVEIGFALAWQTAGQWDIPRLELAKLCQKAENDYVGVKSGLMDQFACAFGVAGHALALDTRSLAWHTLPLPKDVAIVIADSGVRRSLAASTYNNLRADCQEAVERLRTWCSSLTSLRDVTPQFLQTHLGELPERVARRAQHVVGEMARVEQAIGCLTEGDSAGFGSLMLATHASLRDFYQVSCPELDLLVELADSHPACYGARLTGAGFGGCTVNLVARDGLEEFVEWLKAAVMEKSGRDTPIEVCQAADGAHLVI